MKSPQTILHTASLCCWPLRIGTVLHLQPKQLGQTETSRLCCAAGRHCRPISARCTATKASTDRISIVQPDDWHLHVRDGAGLKSVVPHTSKHFARAIIMPNLVPPVTDSSQVTLKGHASTGCHTYHIWYCTYHNCKLSRSKHDDFVQQ